VSTIHTLASARAACLFRSSYDRLQLVLEYRRHLSGLDWWRLFGNQWSSCDNIFEYREGIRDLLRAASREQLDAMMTDEELRQLAALPNPLSVYRGCYDLNANGLSWSTDRDVAAKFPTLLRYKMGGIPIMRSGWVEQERVVLKLDRDDFEVIAHDVRLVTESSIEAQLTPSRRRGPP
jgi:hypothetical protein